jgi:hypothetical protein
MNDINYYATLVKSIGFILVNENILCGSRLMRFTPNGYNFLDLLHIYKSCKTTVNINGVSVTLDGGCHLLEIIQTSGIRLSNTEELCVALRKAKIIMLLKEFSLT